MKKSLYPPKILTSNYFQILDDDENKEEINEFQLLDDIFEYYPHFKKLCHNYRGNKYILIPDYKFFDFEMRTYYSELLKTKNNFTNILFDYKSIYNKTKEEIQRTMPEIKILDLSDNKSRILLRSDILDGIKKENLHDFNAELDRFTYWLKKTYDSYRDLSVKGIIDKSKAFTLWSFEYKTDKMKYNKDLLLKEIRKYQIMLYRYIYEIVKIYYDKLEVSNLDAVVSKFKEEYLGNLATKYESDENNKDLMEYFIKNKFFINFNYQIELLLKKFSKEYEYYRLTRNIFFDTIKTSYYLKEFLYILFDINDIDIRGIKNIEQTPKLIEYFSIKKNIDTLIETYFSKPNKLLFKYDDAQKRYVLNGDFGEKIKKIINQQFNILYEKLEKEDIKFIIFLNHFIYYEVLYLYDVEQINEPIFSHKMHEKYRKNKLYNIGLREKLITIDSLDEKGNKLFFSKEQFEQYEEKRIKLNMSLYEDKFKIEENKPVLLLGNSPEIRNYILDAEDYYALLFFNDIFNYEQVSNLTSYNPTLNDMYIYSQLKNKKKALYINNSNNKLWKYKEHDKKYFQSFIDNYTYIGLLQIMTTEAIQRTIDIILCYNNKNNSFCLFDLMGNQIRWGTILYEPQITYREMIHVKLWGYKFFVYKNDRDLKYIFISDNTFNKPDYEEIYLNVPDSKIDWYDNMYLSFFRKPIIVKQSGGNINIENIIKKESKTLTKYIKKFTYIIDKIKKNVNRDILNYYLSLFNNYEYIITENRDFYNVNNEKIKTPTTILNYKIQTIGALFFIEMNYKYNLIEDTFTNIYEISNNRFIGDAIIIINDRLIKKHTLKTLYIDYLTTLNREKIYLNNLQEKIKIQYGTDLQKDIKNIDFINIFSQTQLFDEINKINKIDFLIININVFNNIDISRSLIHYITYLYLLYIFNLVKSKLNINSNLCIAVKNIRSNFAIKIITLICSFYEEYFITTPESNNDRPYIYIILKHKKINNDSDIILDKLQEKIIKNCPKLGIDEKYVIDNSENKEEITNHILNFCKNETYIEDIEIKDKKLYKKLKRELIVFNTQFYFNAYNLYKKIYHNIKNNIKYTKEEENLRKEKNLYACIQWSKKYEVPLVPEIDFDSYGNKIKLKIFSDIISFEKDFCITLKNHEKNIIEFKTNDDFDDIPIYFKRALIKAKLETRALDKRPLNIYHQVKVRIDYYYKKLTKEVSQRFKLSNDYVSNAWLKMTELLNKVDLINKKAEKIKTFHMCELPGSFINAVRFYINTKTNIKEFEWKAQSLNPNRKDKDERIAFGDEANMLKKYPNNYDFGYNDSGDITDYKNIEYYRKNDNDFVTADCGLPYNQKELAYILSYAQYLMIFACCKVGGNCVLKRFIPIENTQEIYMMYLFYCVFDKVIIYKPKLNYQSQEYYLCGINYLGIDNKLFEKLIDYLKKFKLDGFSIKKIPENFLVQIDKAQHELLDNRNGFIKKKIYFCDKFESLSDDDWENINKTCKEKIKEWFENCQL